MDKERVKGMADDAAERAKRQAGERTGEANKQMEGAGQQAKGKAEKAWGNAKDAARHASHNASHQAGRDDRGNRGTGSGPGLSGTGAEHPHKTH